MKIFLFFSIVLYSTIVYGQVSIVDPSSIAKTYKSARITSLPEYYDVEGVVVTTSSCGTGFNVNPVNELVSQNKSVILLFRGIL